MSIRDFQSELCHLVVELRSYPATPRQEHARRIASIIAEIEQATQGIHNLLVGAGLLDRVGADGCTVPDPIEHRPGFSAPLALLGQGEYATHIVATDNGMTEVRHA